MKIFIMPLLTKSLFVFLGIIVLLGVAAWLPSAATMMIVALLSGCLAIYQTLAVLMDDSPNLDEELAEINCELQSDNEPTM